MYFFFSQHFKRQLKKLQKKFPHAKENLLYTIENTDIKNEVSIGQSIYKIRIKSTDLQKGQSGGFRLYTYFFVQKNLLAPLCIYAKSDKITISENELQYHCDKTIEEIVQFLC